MITKRERTLNTAKQNKDQTQNFRKQWEQLQTMNIHQQNHRLRNDSSQSHQEAYFFLTSQIFTLYSAVIKIQNVGPRNSKGSLF